MDVNAKSVGRRRPFKGKRIGVLMGGISEEREISLRSGAAVVKALRGSGYTTVAIDAKRDVVAAIKKQRIDAAFIALHGRYGEDGCIQGVLELMNIPYTGSGVLASATAMDKAAAKRLFVSAGITVPDSSVVERRGKPEARPALPVVVKPVSQGSTLGLSVVTKRDALERAIRKAMRYGKRVLVERYIKGRELTVSILDAETFPVIEISPRQGLYDFKAKYTHGMTEFTVPARINKHVEARVKKAALDAYRSLGCSGAARVDLVLGTDQVAYVLELNTVPGMTELSLLPMAANAAGLGYPALVEAMLSSARTENG